MHVRRMRIINRCLRASALASSALAAPASGQVGTPYCTANLNSSGAAAAISAGGSADVALNQLTLECTALPVGMVGIFLVSPDAGFLPNPGGSAGDLCLGGAIGRYSANPLVAGTDGRVSMPVDFAVVETPSGSTQAQAGETLHFQFWYRDTSAGAASSNYSDGLRVEVQCRASLFPARQSPIGVFPAAMTTVDLNGDGLEDVAVVGGAPGRLAVVIQGPGDSFDLESTTNLAGRGVGVDAGDLDGDGDLDLAVAISGSGGIQLFINDGAGSLTASTLLLGGTNTTLVRVAEAAGGGALDILAVSGGELYLLRGMDDGNFSPPERLKTTATALSCRTGDFDGDGLPDIAALMAQGDIAVFLGSTIGALGAGVPAQTISANATPGSTALLTADWDGDGSDSIAVIAAGTVSILDRTNPPGFVESLALPLTTPIGGSATEIHAGDLEGDGDLDLVVLTGGSTEAGLITYPGDGLGGLGLPLFSTTGEDIQLVSLLQLDGVGALDIVGCDVTSWCLTAFEGDGLGVFQTAPEYAAPGRPHRIQAADFDGDGDLDLAVSAIESGEVSIVESFNGVLFGATTTVHTKERPLDLAPSDLDADGDIDLVVAHGQIAGQSALSVLMNRGDGTFDPSLEIPMGATQTDLAIADLNGDGTPDIVVAESTLDRVSVIFGLDNGAFAPPLTISVPGGATRIAVGDIDMNGFNDIVCASNFGSSVSFIAGLGLGQFAQSSVLFSVPFQRDVATSDLDGDGDLEIVIALPDGVQVFEQSGLLLFTLTSSESFLAQSTPQLLLEDLDADGFVDVVLGSASYGSVQFWLGSGDTTLGARRSFHAPGLAIATVADLDGDGVPDIALASGERDTVTILRNRGCD